MSHHAPAAHFVGRKHTNANNVPQERFMQLRRIARDAGWIIRINVNKLTINKQIKEMWRVNMRNRVCCEFTAIPSRSITVSPVVPIPSAFFQWRAGCAIPPGCAALQCNQTRVSRSPRVSGVLMDLLTPLCALILLPSAMVR